MVSSGVTVAITSKDGGAEPQGTTFCGGWLATSSTASCEDVVPGGTEPDVGTEPEAGGVPPAEAPEVAGREIPGGAAVAVAGGWMHDAAAAQADAAAVGVPPAAAENAAFVPG